MPYLNNNEKGDLWDKGGADLYVLRQLLSLHRRYPNRVHFLMGNRDINKMRIVDELGTCDNDGDSSSDNDGTLPTHEGVYWLRDTVCSDLPADPESSVPSNSAAERLKWMLRKTMGSADAFELRRSELKNERIAIMNKTSASPTSRSDHTSIDCEIAMMVTDDEVARSYILSCHPVSGIMSQCKHAIFPAASILLTSANVIRAYYVLIGVHSKTSHMQN